ncbi:MAG: polymer-forming cytoskeletal protein [bacterium]
MPKNKHPFDYRRTAGIYCSTSVSGSVDIQTSEDVVLDGALTGTINSTGFCEITENGSFKGDITARTITIFGEVDGDCQAQEGLLIKRSAKIRGVFHANSVQIDSGSTINARIKPLNITRKDPL